MNNRTYYQQSTFPSTSPSPLPVQSPDRLGGMGGLYNTLNLYVYGYAFNNPIRYDDPDGREIRVVDEKDNIFVWNNEENEFYSVRDGRTTNDVFTMDVKRSALTYLKRSEF